MFSYICKNRRPFLLGTCVISTFSEFESRIGVDSMPSRGSGSTRVRVEDRGRLDAESRIRIDSRPSRGSGSTRGRVEDRGRLEAESRTGVDSRPSRGSGSCHDRTTGHFQAQRNKETMYVYPVSEHRFGRSTGNSGLEPISFHMDRTGLILVGTGAGPLRRRCRDAARTTPGHCEDDAGTLPGRRRNTF